jgi:PAS domain S-box-containing protein
LLDPILQNTAPFSVYYAAVMCTAWYGGLGPALVALVSGAVLADYLFIEPRLSLFASNLEHQVGLGLYVAVGVVVAVLSESLHASRRRTETARAELAKANHVLQKEIAERQQAERWLLESEHRFRGYFEQGLVGMAMLSAEKDWIEANHRVCQMLGYSEKELMSKKWGELVHRDDLAGDEAHFKQLLGGVVQGYVADQRFLRKDGKILYASLSVQCMWKPEYVVIDQGFSDLGRDSLFPGLVSIFRHFPDTTVQIWTVAGGSESSPKDCRCPKLREHRHLRF